MVKRHIGSSLFVTLLLLFPIACLAANGGSCVTCHTSDAIMKAMYKAPVMPPGEGEG
jgi:hypothetical protein